jgi:hypothetical protein
MQQYYRRLLLVLALAAAASAKSQLSTTDESLHSPTISHNGNPIVQPRTMAMHAAFDKHDPLKPTITFNRIDDLSYDAVYTFTNNTDQPKALGQLTVGTITLGQRVSYLNLHRGAQLKNTTWDTYTAQAWRYPLTAYSPATAIMNGDYAVGVSLLYPILEYKHDVLVTVNKAGGVFKGPKESRGWYIAFDLSNGPWASQYTAIANPAILQPNQSRSYTVAVRAIKRNTQRPSGPTAAQDWLETLLPYRDHFQQSFGPVTYTRDNRAVHGKEAANIGAASNRNPRGFFGDRTSRPDLAGFGTLSSILSKDDGFKRVMLWAPSGVYRNNPKNNYPPQFTLGWDSLPLLRTTSHRLRNVGRSGKELGLWWGRSTQFTNSWDPETLETIDFDNREHLRSIGAQLQLAKDAGATSIGLDNFTHALMPVWDQIRLIRAINNVYPEFKLIAEPMCCDIVHSVAPSFVSAYRAPKTATKELDFHRLKTPNYLADFLLPGHESWALFRYSEIRRVRSTDINATRMQRDAEHLARLGYVPVMLADFPLGRPERARADKSWLTTVPAHLKQPESATTGPEAKPTAGSAPPR